ncbi:MAG: chemotaxis protein CheB [Myxococcota bacterium]
MDPPPTPTPGPLGHGDDAFAIVGVGASAGGLEAYSQLLAALPSDTGMAFVLLQHLDPTHESALVGLLARFTRMPIVEATQGLAVERDHVYVIPPNATLTIAGRALQLGPRSTERVPHLPIDHFLQSLAEDQKACAIGVILSGSGTDGTRGLEEIKAEGGITFAQQPESAKHPSMPQSAVRSGCVDRVLPVAEIASELARVGRHPYVSRAPVEGASDGAHARHFEKVLALLRRSAGVDFSAYRDSTIQRRILRRMMLHSKETLGDYARQLETDRTEIDALYQDILINVTRFFRDAETFDLLKQSVFPEVWRCKSANTPIRVWVSGCSTGQEAYSMAIALLEFLDEKTIRPPVQIFATDINDASSLQKARAGVYPDSIEAEVSSERLRRFFSKEEGGRYRVARNVRDLCVFAKHNVAADPPFSHMDLISCRNLLIYLSPALQKRVIPTLHYALNPNGYLLLGASETVGSFGDLFTLVDPAHRVYAKRAITLRQYPHFRSDADIAVPSGARTLAAGVPSTPPTQEWQREADRMLLGRYAPAGVLVSDNLEILQFRGETGAFLTPSPGEASFNLMRMARDGLFPTLRSATEECRASGTAVRRDGIRVHGENEIREIDLHVLPVKLLAGAERCFLILFEEPRRNNNERALAPGLGATERSRHAEASGFWSRLSGRLATGSSRDEGAAGPEEARLRQELQATREYMQSLVEQHAASTEELQSANEEILSANEELQSTNEELETAKEELQSVNEELTTVNEQLQYRNRELSRTSDDLNNLQTSADLAIVLLGVDLRIRRFTPAAAQILKLQPSDQGRPIGDLRPLDVPDLRTLLLGVIGSGELHEREVHDGDDRWYALQIHPYRTADGRIDGCVLVLADVSAAKAALTQIRAARNYAEAIVETVSHPLVVLDDELRVQSANAAFHRMFETVSVPIDGQPLAEVGVGRWNLERMLPQLLALRSRGPNVADFEVELSAVSGERKVVIATARRVVLEGAETGMILLSIEDISARKRLEAELAGSADELRDADRRKNEFLALLAHELRNPLALFSVSLELMRLADGDRAQTEDTRARMERQVQHMARLLDDLLDVSRITRGQIELRKQPLDLSVVARQVAEACRPRAEGSGRALTLHLDPKPVLLDADPDRIEQVIDNLLSNAIKYTRAGDRIDVATSLDGDFAVLRVRDTGIGIASGALARIWELFGQGDPSSEAARSGLGIGLTLVRRLVELHQGTVDVESDGANSGSVFTVRLPLAKSDAAPAPPKERRRLAPKRPHRILVVDDNSDHADSLGTVLRMMGHESYVAYEGVGALAAALEFRPDVVFLDIGLPGMDGYEVARRLRADGSLDRVYLIGLSGHGSLEDRRSALDSGFDAYLVKPALPKQLQQVLEEIPGVSSEELRVDP